MPSSPQKGIPRCQPLQSCGVQGLPRLFFDVRLSYRFIICAISYRPYVESSQLLSKPRIFRRFYRFSSAVETRQSVSRSCKLFDLLLVPLLLLDGRSGWPELPFVDRFLGRGPLTDRRGGLKVPLEVCVALRLRAAYVVGDLTTAQPKEQRDGKERKDAMTDQKQGRVRSASGRVTSECPLQSFSKESHARMRDRIWKVLPADTRDNA